MVAVMRYETKKAIKEALSYKGGRSRPDKSLPYIFPLLSTFEKNKYILDVGCGRGTIGKAIFTEFPHKFYLSGVDIFPDYFSEAMLDYYTEVIFDNFLQNYQKYICYDVFLFIDVLEHFSKDKAIEIIKFFRGNDVSKEKKIIASIPNSPKHWTQAKGFQEKNKYEKHLHDWTNDEVEKELGLKLIDENDGIGVYTNVQVDRYRIKH